MASGGQAWPSPARGWGGGSACHRRGATARQSGSGGVPLGRPYVCTYSANNKAALVKRQTEGPPTPPRAIVPLLAARWLQLGAAVASVSTVAALNGHASRRSLPPLHPPTETPFLPAHAPLPPPLPPSFRLRRLWRIHHPLAGDARVGTAGDAVATRHQGNEDWACASCLALTRDLWGGGQNTVTASCDQEDKAPPPLLDASHHFCGRCLWAARGSEVQDSHLRRVESRAQGQASVLLFGCVVHPSARLLCRWTACSWLAPDGRDHHREPRVGGTC